jgi:hypothetical protein
MTTKPIHSDRVGSIFLELSEAEQDPNIKPHFLFFTTLFNGSWSPQYS